VLITLGPYVNVSRALIASALIATVAALLVQRRAISHFRIQNESLQERHANGNRRAQEEQELARSADPQRRNKPELNEQSNEVHRLRGEVGRLRREVPELAQAKADLEESVIVATDWARRKKQLQGWLEQEPSESIPELQFVTGDDWVRAVLFNPLKTDEDYRRAMSLMRANAIIKSVDMIYPALRLYAQANNGQFPTQVTQLEPYFNVPVDGTILERYQILPAINLRGMIKDEEIPGFGEWVITEKSAVNQTLDDRFFIGLTNILGTTRRTEPNRWGGIP
jgi:hypothetical protein